MADLNYTFKDSTGAVQTARGTNDGTGKIIPIHENSAGEAHVGQVGGAVSFIYQEIIRPNNTTPYTAGDVVSADAGAITWLRMTSLPRVANGSGYITGVRISTDKKSITPRFRLHMYNAETATIAFDNLPYKKLYVDEPNYLGYVDLPAMSTPTDSTNSTLSTAQDLTIRLPFDNVASYLSCQLEALDGFTPAAFEKFSVFMLVDQN